MAAYVAKVNALIDLAKASAANHLDDLEPAVYALANQVLALKNIDLFLTFVVLVMNPVFMNFVYQP